jgi:elongation of very long chain fatty acids protein 4
MVLNWWMATKYIPVGQSFFVGMINSWIHTLMYVYYALAALGPSMQKYLWWKKHMTTLQLIQLVAVISHTSYNKFLRPNCDYPFLYNSIVFYYTWSMVVLFSHFFYTAYVRTGKRPPRTDQKVTAVSNGYYSGKTQNGSGDHNADNNNLAANGSGISHRKRVQ